MDPLRFDSMARGLARLGTRRGALGGLFGGLLLPLLPDDETDARKKRRNNDHDKRRGKDTHRDTRDGQKRQNANHVRAEKEKKKKKKCKPPTIKCGKTCKDVSSDASNCGACGNVCAAGQSCQGGACTCNGAACSGCCDGKTCQAGTTDQQCGAGGAGGASCTGGRTCQGGACACPAGQDICNDVCVDLQTTQNDCGQCGRTCPAGTTCEGGECTCGAGDVCPEGQTCCSGVCRDVQTATAACGDCATACDIQKANQCVGGACKCGNNAACGANQFCCNGTCKTTGTDVANCGACGAVCNAQLANQCVGGACKCGNSNACGTGQRCCNGTCVDIISNAANCGACGITCQVASDRCLNSACKCGSGNPCTGGQTCCNGSCKNLSTDMTACGNCQINCTSTYGQRANRCAGGSCRCGSGSACLFGQTCCNGTCVDLKTDPKNCGSCGGFCAGANNISTTNAICNNGTSCSLTCKGDNYDINDDPNDGCEYAVHGNPTKARAFDLGSSGSCDDVYTFNTAIISDTHEHSPAPEGHISGVKATPQWFKKIGTGAGALCLNDVGIDLTQTSGTNRCYSITIETDLKGSVTIPVVNSKANYEMSSRAYSSGSTIYFKVEKTCPTNRPEVARFQVNYHL